ncbi:DEAD/DEAH box helicase [Pseudobutyrivibrio xylanivorans]|uniref:AAA family ATPase n=1 Tax=Pseudobutyrivibrio xylanivorans TaxID=185007 RepID=A0A5P6VS39_PSEXY|nr:AAA domain-containing protein [Pseudobutyrivibrio xylanivorans]QFJ55280.1 AAA family ATPase [Pseudobutyrivibrio xylanivorans]
MKISEIKIDGQSELKDVSCHVLGARDIVSKSGHVAYLGENSFELVTKDNAIPFSIDDLSDCKMVTDFINRHYYCLAEITSTSSNKESGVIFLHFVFFCNCKRMGRMPLILSENALQYLFKFWKVDNKVDKVYAHLQEQFELTNGLESCFAFESSEKNIKAFSNVEQTENDADEEDDEDTSGEKSRVLVLHGKSIKLYVTLRGKAFEEKLYVERVIKNSNRKPANLMLGIGSLEFTDTGAVLSLNAKKFYDENKGYLDLWNEYSEKEGNFILANARAVGLITLSKKSLSFETAGGVYVGVSDYERLCKLISDNSYLVFADEKPVYLEDPDMTWKEYDDYQEERRRLRIKPEHGTVVKLLRKKNGGFVLDLSQLSLPDSRYVYLSIYGDEKQIQRRKDARRRIASGESANRSLGLILEGELPDVFEDTKNRVKVDPLSSFVAEKIFKNPPTETQKNAIDIALNTPDIAIIQGPPGTGKTTVITAIIERLNEISNKKTVNNGQVLITSFQHDAVRNVIERLSVNSLPTVKFGKQEKDGEEDRTKEVIIEKWCTNYAEALKNSNPDLIQSKDMRDLAKAYNFYQAYPSDSKAVEFLECAKRLNNEQALNEIIERLLEEYSQNVSNDKNDFIDFVRRLRVTKEGFSDDGADNAYDLLQELESLGLDRKKRDIEWLLSVLEEASDCFDNEPNDELLNELVKVKKFLLGKCMPRITYSEKKANHEITDIYLALQEHLKKRENKEIEILSELLKEVEGNSDEVERTLNNYLYVYSATTQQSEGSEIKDAKGVELWEHPEYETVIVDEAARVSPIDLMIPLAQGKRRIILVGDHRQLPHIYNEEVLESIDVSKLENLEMDNIKKSMFEYLLGKAKKLEEQDHIPRTIVLDAQYRMHPMLGNFINETFYAPHNESFTSPLEESFYRQGLYKKPVMWVNMPNDKGPERKEGTSRARDCEARCIVELIKKHIKSSEGKALSYGVISFYSEQVRLIKRLLKADDELKEYQDKVKEIRVGSVDAFQGMEFDVIYLSVVRTNKKDPMYTDLETRKQEPVDFSILSQDEIELEKDKKALKIYRDYKEQVGLQNYGFLISENRLCVSLSRQKKLLIVVGDRNIFCEGKWDKLAEVCVPGMWKLLRLCEREGVVVDGT